MGHPGLAMVVVHGGGVAADHSPAPALTMSPATWGHQMQNPQQQ